MAKNNSQKNKQVKPNIRNQAPNDSQKNKGRRSSTMTDILSVVISGLALLVSFIALHYSTQYAKLEYDYKVDPQIEITGSPEIMRNPSGGSYPLAAMSEFYVSILEKNNLDRAYVIYAGNQVEALDLDDMEGTLAGKIKSGLDTEPDIVAGEWEYRYFFLYLESLDGGSNLHLIYTKSSPGNLVFNGISGIEVFGLANEKHERAEDFEGERMMAREYVRILKELPEYMGW